MLKERVGVVLLILLKSNKATYGGGFPNSMQALNRGLNEDDDLLLVGQFQKTSWAMSHKKKATLYLTCYLLALLSYTDR